MEIIKHSWKKILAFTDRNMGWLDAMCATLLALIPIGQHYIGLIDNLGTTILGILIPYLLIRAVLKRNTLKVNNLKLVIYLILFFIYMVVAHGTSVIEIGQAVLVIGYLVAGALGLINVKKIIQTATWVSVVAGGCLIIQYLCYYVFGFHLQLVLTPLLLPSSEAWILGAQTGLAGITGEIGSLYRPSAFFLEPSHLFMYSFPLLFLNLFQQKCEKRNIICAVLISSGMVLCTSGMGIMVTGFAWTIFFLLWNEKKNTLTISNVLRKQNKIRMVGIILLFVLVIIFVPFVRASVIRIFFNSGGSTAISGRTSMALIQLRRLSGLQWIFGASDTTIHLNCNMPGFMATLYKYGWIGVILSYEFYIKGIRKLELSYVLFAVVLIGVSLFSAHTHGTFFMLFYVFMLIEGHQVKSEAWINELKTFLRRVFKRKKREK